MEDGKEKAPCVETKPRDAELRPARQRMDLAGLLFSGGNRRVSAEMLDAEAPGKEKTPCVETKLRDAGLRPTRQRMDLAGLLFGNGNRHVTAEMLHAEALANKMPVSLATVYNTLNQFAEAGLLREVAIEGSKTYFDTTISDHQHFYFEHDGRLIDLGPDEEVAVAVRKLPEGMKVARIDVLIRLVPDK